MRAYLLACLALVPSAALAVPVPEQKPTLVQTSNGCPEGSVPAAVAMGVVEMQSRESGEAGAVIAGPMATTMIRALATVTGKEIGEITSVVVLPLPLPTGESGQMWVLFSGPCSPSVAILPPHVAAAVWKQVGSII